MEACKKYDLTVTGCSRQTSLFIPEICEKCLKEAENKKVMVTHSLGKKPLVRGQLAMSNRLKSYGKLYESHNQ